MLIGTLVRAEFISLIATDQPNSSVLYPANNSSECRLESETDVAPARPRGELPSELHNVRR